MSNNKIYVFFYCVDIHVSAYYPISLHYSIKGAYQAMKLHKLNKYKEWLDERREFGKHKYNNKFAVYEDWYIAQREILD